MTWNILTSHGVRRRQRKRNERERVRNESNSKVESEEEFSPPFLLPHCTHRESELIVSLCCCISCVGRIFVLLYILRGRIVVLSRFGNDTNKNQLG